MSSGIQSDPGSSQQHVTETQQEGFPNVAPSPGSASITATPASTNSLPSNNASSSRSRIGDVSGSSSGQAAASPAGHRQEPHGLYALFPDLTLEVASERLYNYLRRVPNSAVPEIMMHPALMAKLTEMGNWFRTAAQNKRGEISSD